jgi:hypothetical protein
MRSVRTANDFLWCREKSREEKIIVEAEPRSTSAEMNLFDVIGKATEEK